MEWIFILAVIYFLFVVPFKLWKTEGQFNYYKQDNESKVSQLEFNNNFYIDQIHSLQAEVKRFERESKTYYAMWWEEVEKMADIEECLYDLPDSDTKTKILEIINSNQEEENDIS